VVHDWPLPSAGGQSQWPARFRTIPAFTTWNFQQMAGYFFMKDRDSHFIGCNAAFAEFAGETMESLIPKHETHDALGRRGDHFIADDRRVMETGEGLINYTSA
jgi:PAS domain-containing protein